MDTGKLVRMNRIFAHPSGRLCSVAVAAAGGPKTQTLESALAMIHGVVQSGARGATIGRNVWGFSRIGAAIHAFKAVIHDGKTVEEAVQVAGT